MNASQNQSTQTKNIGFISTRIAGTDGVSLEIKKWAEVLKRNGHNCFYFAGKLDRPPVQSYLMEEAHFEHPIIQEIGKDVFGKKTRKPEISKTIQLVKNKLKDALYDFTKKFNIDLIIPENALAIPLNIPLGIAITEFIAETRIPTIAHHHDFYWERIRYSLNACQDYLNMAFPADLPSIHHVVINSIASEQLSHRHGISNTVIPNVLDFSEQPPNPDHYCDHLREKVGLEKDDLFILQPTRVIPRKWIERSIEIVKYLNLPKSILVVSHATADEGGDYYQHIQDYARNLDVKIVTIDHLITEKRGKNEKGEQTYTICDMYQCADLITYPSSHEGFGNAFLEAIYYKKPIIVNPYSIYVVDIAPKEFEAILFKGFLTSREVERIETILKNEKKLREMVDKNYTLAKKYYSYEVLEEKLMPIIHAFMR